MQIEFRSFAKTSTVIEIELYAFLVVDANVHWDREACSCTYAIVFIANACQYLFSQDASDV